MKKTDIRIRRTTDTIDTETQLIENDDMAFIIPEDSVMVPRPCEDEPEPPQPDFPTPNPDRPPDVPVRPDPNPERPTPPSPYGRLEFVDGLQRIGNKVSVKVNEDSKDYLKATPKGVSAKFLIDRLNNVRKALGGLSRTTTVLRSDINQLQDELDPINLTQIFTQVLSEFHVDEHGQLVLNLGNGLILDTEGNISANVDKLTTDIDDNGEIVSVWTGFDRGE